jgi:CheY-like chemotaxis protein
MSFTLLIADDSPTIQRVIQLTFADEDVHVVAVDDGDQAIERLDADELPHIVLADVDMPGKNGYEVARHIKGSPRLAHIPVVLLTGPLDPSRQPAESGCDGILSKPFEPRLAIAIVHELLNRTATAIPDSPASPGAATPGAAAPSVPAETPAAVPTLADAFAALLEAEQRGDEPSARAIWPAAAEPTAIVTDDLIEEVVRRVLARLPDGTVREAVKDAVSGVAERLVLEEIQRIKAAIR